MGTTILILAFIVAVITAPIVGAFLLDKRHRRLRPNCRPFGWGFYNALGAFLAPLIVTGQVAAGDSSAAGVVFIIALCIYVPLGILTLRRNRWGYVALTVLSLNPLLWIINAIYIHNRWNEMKSTSIVVRQPPPLPPAPTTDSSFQLEENLYFHLNDKVQGPFTPQQVQSLVQVGTVSQETLCCAEGSQAWRPFHTLFT